MDFVALIGISVGLAMDAFAVSITNGAAYRSARVRDALKIALFFGFFQALMPALGWLAGSAFSQFIAGVDHWVALILLGYIGGRMLWEAAKKRKQKVGDAPAEALEGFASTKTLLLLAVATSIDALATGLILPSAVGASTLPLMACAVGSIGVITFAISFSGVYIGKKCGTLLQNKAEFFGGAVLVLIGLKIFVDHMFFSA